MFCHITENWRGRPLVSREVVVNLIGNTTTETGVVDPVRVGRGKLSDGPEGYGRADEGPLDKKDKFHGEWNYTIIPTADIG